MSRTPAAESNDQSNDTPSTRHWIITAGLMTCWLIVALSLGSHHASDWPAHSFGVHAERPQNLIGKFGAVLSDRVYTMWGLGAWVAMSGALAYLIARVRRRKIDQLALRIVGMALVMIASSALIGLYAPGGLGAAHLGARAEGAGGLVAQFINYELTDRFNVLGTWIILILTFWVGLLLAADHIVLWAPYAIFRLLQRHGATAAAAWTRPAAAANAGIGAFWARRAAAKDVPVRSSSTRNKKRRSKAASDDDEDADDHIDEDAGGLGGTESFDPEPKRRKRRSVRDEVEEVEDVDDEIEVDAELDEGDDVEYEYEDEEEDADVEAGASLSPDDIDEDEADEADAEEDEDEEVTAHDAAATYADEKKFDPDELRKKIDQMQINFAPKSSKGKAPPAREIDLSGYQFPEINLLEEPESNFSDEMEKIVRDQAVVLESALREYRIEGEVVGIDAGPVITLFEVALAPGTKVSRINTVSSDLARALKAHNIRVVPNMVGRDTIGIEVPNLKKEKVRLKELMVVNAAETAKMKLPMYLGKDASGNPLIQDLATMPHMLIAGTTGSGKSVCMNAIIMSFLFTKRPDELKMVLVDPKMVEMSLFRDIPHLMCPVVTEMNKAAAILEWAVTKMDERYELLAEVGVRDIAGYNNLGWEEIKARIQPATEAEEIRIPKKLPYLVFIIDELADLMMTNKEVEGFIVRIAQKARAVGIHLILATQRPQANVVTGLIKSNMPCRVSFKVSSGMDSRIVLDQKGAELLLGHGDMLFLSPRSSELIRAQGSLVDDMEVRLTVKFLKDIAGQNFEPQLVQLKSTAADGESDDSGPRDPLFDDAVRVVLESQRGSVSLLQRRLTIGYSKASRLIEQIGEAGIIGEYKGSQAREVNMTLEEWEAIQAQVEADAESRAGQTTTGEQEELAYDENDENVESPPWNDGDDQADVEAEDAYEESEEEEDGDVPDEFPDEYRQ